LVVDESETDDASIIGAEAHIIAKTEEGPRGKSSLSIEDRNKYNNLILLCSIHHKLIDDQENTYTVELLHQFKDEHENWVKSNLSIDYIKEREDLIYSDYIDKFIELAEANTWKDWTSFVFHAGQPRIKYRNIRKLKELIEYTLSRVWSGRYPNLEKAFYNFKAISNDFMFVFEEYMEDNTRKNSEEIEDPKDDTLCWVEKFYKIKEWDTERYNQLLTEYEYHCFLIEDLALEMTRAVNHLFDMVRLYLFPSFRIKEGVVLVVIGPFMDLSWHTIRTEYKADEKIGLYPGLRKFMEIRTQRNYFRGNGFSEKYFINFDKQ